MAGRAEVEIRNKTVLLVPDPDDPDDRGGGAREPHVDAVLPIQKLRREDVASYAVDWLKKWTILCMQETRGGANTHGERVPHRLVCCFDIDHTLLITTSGTSGGEGGRGRRITPICELYQWCLDQGLPIYLITARTEDAREFTQRQLQSTGIVQYEHLLMHPAHVRRREQEVGAHKAKHRRFASANNKRVCLNIGDAWSDHFAVVPRHFKTDLDHDESYLFVTIDGCAHLKL